MAETTVALDSTSGLLTGAERSKIAHDLELMNQFEALVQSLPDHRAEAGLGPLSDDATRLSYDLEEPGNP